MRPASVTAPHKLVTNGEGNRSRSFGESGNVTVVDRFGVWLSKRQIERAVGSLSGRDVADIGCGYDATFMRHMLAEVGSATLIDVSIAPDLVAHPKVRATEGFLPGAMELV